MSNGKIKWFNPTKGYGFIENDAGGKDIFLHVSALEQAGIDLLKRVKQFHLKSVITEVEKTRLILQKYNY